MAGNVRNKKMEILVDGVLLSDKQTAVVGGLAKIGWYACSFGAIYAAAEIGKRFHVWNERRKYKNFLEQVEKEKAKAEKA
jgi:hypothetical protein